MESGIVAKAASIITMSDYLIALTGAGISKESNVPTFRGKNGLWKNYNPMDLATPSAFSSNPKLVWQWYSWRQNIISNCEPNPAHTTLAKWEEIGILKSLITQNVDGLHRRAGSKNIQEVHGDIWAIKCPSCSYHNRIISPAEEIPRCPRCKGNLRPDVVWFGESLNPAIISQVYEELERADVCLVIGTSALVQPAASFPLIVKQHNGVIIEVNVERTPLTPISEVHINEKAGEALPVLDELMHARQDSI
jgi:NAD-dependent deacetylase